MQPNSHVGFRNRNLIAFWMIFAANLCIASTDATTTDSVWRSGTFEVPGHEREIGRLNEMFQLHFPGARPGPTLWDEWLVAPSLWPALRARSAALREDWRKALSSRNIDDEGYVSSSHHISIAHPEGWPIPGWNFGRGGGGWHFSFKDTVNAPYRGDELSTQSGWMLTNASDAGIGPDGWNLRLTGRHAEIQTPDARIDTFQAPFMQLRWAATDLQNSQPYLAWMVEGEKDFAPYRRIFFQPIDSDGIVNSVIPMFRHPEWRGNVTNFKIGFGNEATESTVTIQALFTQYDTRHNVNSQSFISGCYTFFCWTGDLGFLRANINRMRLALRHLMTEHRGGLEEKIIRTDWVGHDGRSGQRRNPDGSVELLSGRGIGNNYWDLLPFGGKDAYATIRYYDSLQKMASIEDAILAHPEWNIPAGPLQIKPDELRRHAVEVQTRGNQEFWNPQTGRFVGWIDINEKAYDYGFTFVNLEAIHYGFALPEHEDSIMQWICGDRIVAGDTSTGADIYHWRFGPRATTRRNDTDYTWWWSVAANTPWGEQVQDGGAVLGFSYHDIMARLKQRGPDDAWQRLREIAQWFEEVQTAGGYRAYYQDPKRGTLQGGGTAGGLGLDVEFVESVLLPQCMIDGFLGFEALPEGLRLRPKIPAEWPEIRIDGVQFRSTVLNISATSSSIEIRKTAGDPILPEIKLFLPDRNWELATPDPAKSGIFVQEDGSALFVETDLGEIDVLVFRKPETATGSRERRSNRSE